MATLNAKLDLRVSAEAKQLLREAADIAHKSMSEFVLDSALTQAEETLLDRRTLRLSPEEWEAFTEALDVPPTRHTRMEQLLKTPSVFD